MGSDGERSVGKFVNNYPKMSEWCVRIPEHVLSALRVNTITVYGRTNRGFLACHGDDGASTVIRTQVQALNI